MRDTWLKIIVFALSALIGLYGVILILRILGPAGLFPSPFTEYITSALVIAVAVLFMLLLFTAVRPTDLKRALFTLATSLSEFTGSVVGVSVASGLSSSAKLDRLLKALENERKRGNLLSSSAEAKVLSLFEDALKPGLDDKIGEAISGLVSRQLSEETFSRSLNLLAHGQNRLIQASRTVSIRGFVNLAIGIIFAVSALAVLKSAVDLVNNNDLSRMALSQAVYIMGVRISLALVITLIAYFFLSLYKRSLDDIKYYQNELTFLDLAATAVAVSYDSKPDGVGAKVAESLLSDGHVAKTIEETRGGNSAAVATRILEKLVDKLPGQGE
jgi:hypothetical protein